MTRAALFILTISILVACSDKDEVPAGILSRQQMQAVMWDMVRTGEFLNGFVLSKDTSIDKVGESQKWYDKVYQLHKITKEKFERSYAYYEQHPGIFKEILDSLSRKQVNAYPGQRPTSPVKIDSAGKRSILPSIDTRIRPFDSVNKKRILKKNSRVQ